MVTKRKGKSIHSFDWILLLSYIGLVGIGLMMLYTTTFHDMEGQNMFSFGSPFGKQLIWVGISIFFLIAAYLIDPQFWNTISFPLYVIGIVFLLTVLLFGTEVKGSKSWITLGSLSIQPGEFVKIATTVYMASILSSIRTKITEYRSQIFVFGILALPIFLIVMQPDPGTAITFLSLFILLYRKGLPSIYFISLISIFLVVVLSLKWGYMTVLSLILLVSIAIILNYNKTKYTSTMILSVLVLTNILTYQNDIVHLSLIINASVIVAYLFFVRNRRDFQAKFSALGAISVLFLLSFSSSYAFNNILKSHQQDRINVWLQPEKCDPRGSLYNLLQSKLAIGSGGLSGKGFLNGTFTKLNYVPEQSTDFIFSSVGEEQGFIGGIGIITIFLVMILRIFHISEFSKYPFSRNLGYGIAGFIFIHFFINIGMTMGITPVIGIPLPFISKGGSSLLTFSIMMGMAMRISQSK